MKLSTKPLSAAVRAVPIIVAALMLLPVARAADMLHFNYASLNSSYFNSTLFLNGQPSTTADVTRLDGGSTTAHFDFAGATASHNLTLHLSSITPTSASSTGTLIIVDLDGDQFTASVSGSWVNNNGTTADFTGMLTNVQPKPCLGDGTFNGTSGSFPMSYSEPAPWTGQITARLDIGNDSNWFTSSSFFGVPASDSAQIVSGGGGNAAGTVQITSWASVRSHAVVGALAIPLDPSLSGNGTSGPTVESRSGGIQRIEVTFGGPVTLTAAPSLGISVVGRTTIYAAHSAVLGPPVSYGPTSVALAGTNTIAINFPPGLLPDDSCYTIGIGPGVINQTLAGDLDCGVRSLSGDATGDGSVSLSDAVLTLVKNACVSAAPRFDLNLSGSISISDALAVKARIASPARQALCP